jgi:hypothetical protein
MAAEGNDPLTKMAISATQLTLFFAIFLRYFSRLHRTNFSQIPQDLSLSCDPGLLLFWLLFGPARPVGPNLEISSRKNPRRSFTLPIIPPYEAKWLAPVPRFITRAPEPAAKSP